VKVEEGAGIPVNEQWPDWHADKVALASQGGSSLEEIVNKVKDPPGGPVAASVSGDVPGAETPEQFAALTRCLGAQELVRPRRCFEECVARFPKAYECWHQLALMDEEGAGKKFAETAKPGHPYLNQVAPASLP